MKKLLTLAFGVAIAMPMLAQLPQTLSFQGYLTSDAGEPITETGLSVAFSLYTASSGGTLVWGPEPQTINVDRGIFSTVLGSVEPLGIDANAPYFLQISIGAETLPRIAVTSGVYSLSTTNAENITSNQLAIANGGTNAANVADARANLGVEIGTDVQGFDNGLNSIAGLTTVADQMVYLTGSDTYATTGLTGFGRTLLDDVDASAAQTTLDLLIGTDVQAFDAGLTSIAGLTTAQNQMLYLNGSDSYTTTPLSGFGRSLVDDADASAARSTLQAQESDAGLSSIAGLTTASDRMIYTTASDVYAATTLTSFARNLLDDGNSTAALSTLGAQPADADLTDLAEDGSLTGSKVGSGINATNITTGTLPDGRLESTIDVTRINTTGGLHVGGTSDPGTDNAIVDGTLGVGASPSTTFEVVHGSTGPSNGDGLSITSGSDKWTFFTFPTSNNLLLYYNDVFKGQFDDSDGAYSNSSDRNLKKNIVEIPDVLHKIKKLPIRNYHYKTQQDSEEKEIGVIAQEVLKVFPSLVEYSEPSNLYSVKYSQLGPLAIKAIQEQQEIIESLKTELSAVKKQLSGQKSSNEKLMSRLSEQEEKINMLFELLKSSKQEEITSKSTSISEKK